MAHGPAADIGLADSADWQGRHHAGRNVKLFKGILHGQRVHHRCQHAHVVSGRTLHPRGRAGHAAEDVPTTDDKTGFNTGVDDVPHLAGDGGNHFRINPVRPLAHQGLTRNLQKNAWVQIL